MYSEFGKYLLKRVAAILADTMQVKCHPRPSHEQRHTQESVTWLGRL